MLVEFPALGRVATFLAPRGSFRLRDASAALFRTHVNERFTVRSPGRRSEQFVLAHVSELPVTNNFAQFSLVFHGPAGDRVADAIHRFEHPVLGNFDLFISAAGPVRAERTTYQACFSRRLEASSAASRTA